MEPQICVCHEQEDILKYIYTQTAIDRYKLFVL